MQPFQTGFSHLVRANPPLRLHDLCRKPCVSFHGSWGRMQWCFQATLPCGSYWNPPENLSLAKGPPSVSEFPPKGGLVGHMSCSPPPPSCLHIRLVLCETSPSSEANAHDCLWAPIPPFRDPAVLSVSCAGLSCPWNLHHGCCLSVCLSMTLITFIMNSVLPGNLSQCPRITLWNLPVWSLLFSAEYYFIVWMYQSLSVLLKDMLVCCMFGFYQ